MNKALYCTALYCTALYCTVLHCSVLYCTVLYCTVLYCTVLYCTVLYCTVLYCTVLYCTVLYCTVLYCTVLYCTVLYCSVLQCTVLHCIELSLSLGIVFPIFLACSSGVFWACQYTSSYLYLGFVNCGGLGQWKTCRGSRREVEKMGESGGKGSAPPLVPPAPTLYRSSIQLQSKMAVWKTCFIERSIFK